MEKIRESNGVATEHEKKQLTREQLRHRDRIAKEAESTFNILIQRFTDFFVMHTDPEGKEVQDTIKRMSAQWRLYCTRKGLGVFTLFDDNVNILLKQYEEIKNGKQGEGRKTEE